MGPGASTFQWANSASLRTSSRRVAEPLAPSYRLRAVTDSMVMKAGADPSTIASGQGGRHPAHGLGKLPLVQPREAEARERLRPAIEGVAAAGVPRHAVTDAAARPRLDVHRHADADPERHPAGR